jgi:hypothetical protein
MLRLSGGKQVMSRPPTAIEPAATATNPQTARSNVVLPQPDAPNSAMNSPPAALSDTRSSTRFAP